MAIIVRILLEPADQDDHDRLQDAVEAGMSRLGGPPEGLMFHLGYPSGQGFLLVEVWRSEKLFQVWWVEVMEPAIAQVGLVAGEPEFGPVWSLARP